MTALKLASKEDFNKDVKEIVGKVVKDVSLEDHTLTLSFNDNSSSSLQIPDHAWEFTAPTDQFATCGWIRDKASGFTIQFGHWFLESTHGKASIVFPKTFSQFYAGFVCQQSTDCTTECYSFCVNGTVKGMDIGHCDYSYWMALGKS